MRVKERHDVQAAVARNQCKSCTYVGRRYTEVGVGQWHEFRARSRACRMQYQAYIVGLGQAVRRQAHTLLPCECEETRRGLTHGTQLDEAEARGAGEVARWRSYVGLHK